MLRDRVMLTGKAILITGGTGALGEAFVKKALRQGAEAFFTYNTDEEKAKELSVLGAVSIKLNLANRAEVVKIKPFLKEKISKLDGLINNAALGGEATIANLEESAWDETIETDLTAPFLLTKKLLPLLYKAPQAKIVNVVSRVGWEGAVGLSAYAAAKAGLVAFTKTLAREVGRKKILVNAFNPGFMMSKMTKDVPEFVLEKNKKRSAIGEFSDPEEAAEFLAFLMSDAATKVTGQVFSWDSR